MKELLEAFREAFSRSGMTQKELAERAGVSRQYISNVLVRTDRTPGAAAIIRLLTVLFAEVDINVGNDELTISFRNSTRKKNNKSKAAT